MDARNGQDVSLAVLELTSIARGIQVHDAVQKRADVHMLTSRTLSQGKYLLLFSGPVADTGESYHAGSAAAEGHLEDHLWLPGPHGDLWPALEGRTHGAGGDSLGSLEFMTVTAAIHAADIVLKTAPVRLLQLVLGQGIGGKGYLVYAGDLADVEACAAAALAAREAQLVSREIIARPHTGLAAKWPA